MNISITNYEDLAAEFSSETTFEKRSKSTSAETAGTSRQFRKRAKGPQQFNGIHRRRTKKIKW